MVFGIGEGKIEIFLDKGSFSYGESIRGRLALTLDKPKKARGLRIALVQQEYRYHHSSKGGTYSWDTIYSFKADLDGEKEYQSRSDYTFEMQIPNSQKPMGANSPDGLLGAVVSVLSRQRKIKWLLDASLDMPGFDINKKIDIAVR